MTAPDPSELQRQLDTEIALRRRLVDIARSLSSTFNVEELLVMVLHGATELLGAETSSLMLVDTETGELEITVATGVVGEQAERQRVPPGKGIAGWTLEHQEPAVVDDPPSDDRFYADVSAALGFETDNLLAVPLTVKERPVGVVEIINKPGGFDQRDVELAQAFASLAAIALDNAAMYAKLADGIVQARMSYRL